MHQEKNISQNTLELIERFLNNELQGQPLIDFEKKLHRDQVLRNQLDFVKNIPIGVERAVLKEKIESFHSELQSQPPTIKLHRTNFFQKIAVAAFFIIGFSLLFYFYQTSPNEKLYQAYFSPDPGLPTVMSSSYEYDFYDAMVDYKRKNYDSAISKWTVLLKNSPSNDTLNYFLGMAWMASKDVEKAFPYLEQVTKNNESVFQDDARFYKALYHVKNNNIDLAKQNLSELTDDKAKKLLEKLNNL
tara:strand:- start:3880 stop:4614 length:735 start_codon:yes stop_codon:yes gene_type:complete